MRRRASDRRTSIDAEAVAARAGADRGVEREQPRLELRQRVVADRAGELAPRTGARAAVGSSISTAIARPSPMRSAVSNDLGQPLLACRRAPSAGRRRRRSCASSVFASFGTASISYDGAVDAHAHEALRAHARRTARRARPCGRAPPAPAASAACPPAARASRRPSARRHATAASAPDGRAVRIADAREQQPQVVVDLGDGADGRARVVRGRLLLDRDRRRQALRSGRRRAFPSAAGTAARRPTATRRSGAGLRRTACRRRASSCPSPTGR